MTTLAGAVLLCSASCTWPDTYLGPTSDSGQPDSGDVPSDSGVDSGTDSGIPIDSGADAGTVLADAGPDVMARVGTTVILDGTGSSANSTSFQWSISMGPVDSTALIVNDNVAVAAFTPDAQGVYIVSLTVSNGTAMDTDTMVIDAWGFRRLGPTTANDSLRRIDIGNGYIWMTSALDSWRFDLATDQFDELNTLRASMGAAGPDVSTGTLGIAYDTSANLWIGLQGNTNSVLRIDTGTMNSTAINYDTPAALGAVAAVTEIDTITSGTDVGDVIVYTTSGFTIVDASVDPNTLIGDYQPASGVASNNIRGLLAVPNGAGATLYVGVNYGMAIFDYAAGIPSMVMDTSLVFNTGPTEDISGFTYDPSTNDLWVSSNMRGLALQDLDAPMFPVPASEIYSVASGELLNDLVRPVTIDSIGDVWVPNGAGLTQIPADGSPVFHWTETEGLPAIDIRAVAVFDGAGSSRIVYATTADGLARLNLP